MPRLDIPQEKEAGHFGSLSPPTDHDHFLMIGAVKMPMGRSWYS